MSFLARHLVLGTLVLAASGCASWLRPIAPPRNGSSNDADRQSVRELLTGSERWAEPERREVPAAESPQAESPQAEPPASQPTPASTAAASESEAAPAVPPDDAALDEPAASLDESVAAAPVEAPASNDASAVPETDSSADRPRVPEKEARLAVGDPITDRAASPAGVERASPLLLGDQLIGVEARDARGVSNGFVRDFLIDRNTGDVIAALTHTEEQDGVLRLLLYRGLAWNDEAAAVVVASAEVPEPELVELFELQEAREISGLVVDVELIVKAEHTTLSVLLRDPENLLHRVAITPGELALRALPELETGLEVQATGVETRDERGKLFLPSSLRIGGATLPLRDASGAVEWNALAARFTSAAAFGRGTIRPVDGQPLPVSGWVLDWRVGRVTHLLAQHDGAPRALPLLSLERVEGGWKTGLGLAALGTLPVFVTDVRPAAAEASAPSAPSDDGADAGVDDATETAH